MDYEDPGWRPVLREGRPATPLEGLRPIFLGLASSLWLYLLVLSSFEATPASPETRARVNLAVTAVGFVLLMALFWFRAKPLRATDASSLLGSYRGRFFILTALAEAPAVGGLVAFFFSGSLWTFAIGLTIATIGLFVAAPSRRNIEFEQQKLNAQGSPLSIGQALTQPSQ